APTLEQLTTMLATLLEERAYLLIIDDVWSRADLDHFLVGGPRCRVLFTTRNAAIAHQIGAQVLRLDPWSEADAIALLARWAPHPFTAALAQKQAIVKRTGYLPLAVRLAGAQMHRQAPDKWLQAFRYHKLQLPSNDIHDSVVKTF